MQQDAEGPDVRSGVDWLTCELLGAHVAGGTDALPDECLGRGWCDRAEHRLGHPEVDDFRLKPDVGFRGGKKHILRLEVAVDDPALVGVLDCSGHTVKEPDPVLDGQRKRVCRLGQWGTVDVRHGEPGPAIEVYSGRMHRDDARMVHRCEDLPLGVESGKDARRLRIFAQDLHRDRAVQHPRLAGAPHRSATARAHKPLDLIPVD